jgi:hypothetical protein
MLPNFPLYIVSKGRWKSRLTSKALEAMHVPYHVVIEAEEYDQYAAVIAPQKLLVLDPAYKTTYDTCDLLDSSHSPGPGPARNFAWSHALAAGHAWHWVMDDNISQFARLHYNKKIRVLDGVFFRCMEDFVLRYTNIAMAGPQYWMFLAARSAYPPFVLNTRIYSCNLIRTDLSYRWRGRYNEDTDLSLRMLQDGWCTVQFNAFMQKKAQTQTVAGGCTEAFYRHEGTLKKSQCLVQMHPDVARLVWKFGRWHHYVDYRRFKTNRLRRNPDVACAAGINDYGMVLHHVSAGSACTTHAGQAYPSEAS